VQQNYNARAQGWDEMAAPAESRRTTDQIGAANALLVQALMRGDGAAAAALYAEDAKLFAPGAGLLKGRAAIGRFWQTGIQVGITSLELETLDLDDEVACELGRYRLRITPEGGEPASEHGEYVVIHRRQADGSWKWALDIFSPCYADAVTKVTSVP
jgi:uncharacterized protein (TIGR02246 family)